MKKECTNINYRFKLLYFFVPYLLYQDTAVKNLLTCLQIGSHTMPSIQVYLHFVQVIFIRVPLKIILLKMYFTKPKDYLCLYLYGIAFGLRISRLLENALGKSKIVNIVADNTYSIMINQFLGFMVVKTVFGLLSKYTSMFPDFSMQEYKSEIWYFYVPKGITQFYIIYLVSGLAVPIIIQLAINQCITKVKTRNDNKCQYLFYIWIFFLVTELL